MVQTEGLGGPCPRCGGQNCFIKKGSGTWYTFIACSDCLFAYGEHADTMMEESGGIVSGVDVWRDLILGYNIGSREEFEEFFGHIENDQFTVESPFDFSDEEEWVLNLLIMSDVSLEILFKAVSHYEEI